jgi:hypothetical protein
MKILELAREWVHSWLPGPACDFCDRWASEESKLTLFHHDDLLICTECFCRPSTIWALDIMYWDEHPEAIPPCHHCRKLVPPEQLVQDVRMDWYFCYGCAYDSNVILYWKRIYRRMWERRAKELGLRKW